MPNLGRGRGSGRPLFGILSASFVASGAREGPTDAQRPGPFGSGRGRFICPLTGPFSHARFVFSPLFFLAFEARCSTDSQTRVSH